MNIYITGGGRGIGLATAKLLSKQGHRVFIGVRNVRQVANTLAAQEVGDSITPIHLDLANPATVAPAVAATLEISGQIDALVNNAGISNLGPFEDQPDKEFERIMNTNFYGHYHLTRAFLPHMREKQKGRIVMVYSLSGLFGLPGETAYCCSKFAIEAMTECLRYEVSLFGIDISIINPSYTQTELAAKTEFDRATPRDSPYRPLMVSLLSAQQAAEQSGDAVETVAESIVSALTDEKPEYRYLPGAAAELHQLWKTSDDASFRNVVEEILGLANEALPGAAGTSNPTSV